MSSGDLTSYDLITCAYNAKYPFQDNSLSVTEPTEAKKMRAMLLGAVHAQKPISIFSDGDVDGVTSHYLMRTYLELAGSRDVRSFISQRDKGYGYMHHKDHAGLVVLLDLGSNDFSEVNKAKRAGLDVVCIDHHLRHGAFPGNAIFNPGGLGPLRNLCTAMLVDFIAGARSPYSAMAALADMCDMSDPLVFNWVREGLKEARSGSELCDGLVSLLKRTGVDQSEVICQDLSWKVIPVINTPARLGDATPALYCFLRGTDVDHLLELNDLRKSLRKAAIAEAEEQVTDEDRIAVVEVDCAPGIVGLVAGQIANQYRIPAVVMSRVAHSDAIKGSVRMPPGRSAKDIYSAVKPHAIRVGGHSGAGGFTFKANRMNVVRDALDSTSSSWSRSKDIPLPSAYDLNITLSDLNKGFLAHLFYELGPFGRGRPVPGCLIPEAAIKVLYRFGAGNSDKHAKVAVNDGHEQRTMVWFNAPDVDDGRYGVVVRVNSTNPDDATIVSVCDPQ